MGWMQRFHQAERDDDGEEDAEEGRLESMSSEYADAPIRRATPQVGRNEAFPCGSGKKFKKCCGSRE